MGLIALNCPNCAGNIELDERKEFGFCLHCGQKIMIQENVKQNQSVDNLLSLAEMALKSNNPDAVERHIEKLLESQINNSRAWLLKGCASCLKNNYSEATISWEKSLSLLSDKDKAIEYLDMVASHMSDAYGRCSFQTLEDIERLDDLDINRINLSVNYELDISPAYISDKILENYRKNERIEDLTDLFFSFSAIVGLTLHSIGYEMSCKNILNRAKNAKEICETYSKARKNFSAVNPNGTEEKLSINKSFIGIFTYEMNNMFSSMETIFQQYFLKISMEDNEYIKKHWMKNRSERFDMNETLYSVMENYFECADKVFCGRIRKTAMAKITDFAKEILKPLQ